MRLMNPFADSGYDELDDRELVKRSVAGSREALEELIQRHQPFVYNVAFKMVRDVDEAWDITQEALMKVVTHLSSFRQESSIRTWLYRIVINHYRTMKRRGCENKVSSFDQMGANLDAIPNPSITPLEEVTYKEDIANFRILCMTAMLLCLSREQRLIYILGEVFGVDDKVGGELFEISPGNFRVRLHRARKDLYTFMNQKCGLVNKANPCRCRSKTKAMIEMGIVDPLKKHYQTDHLLKVSQVAMERADLVKESLDTIYATLYRAHPFDSTEGRQALAGLLAGPEFDTLFQLPDEV